VVRHIVFSTSEVPHRGHIFRGAEGSEGDHLSRPKNRVRLMCEHAGLRRPPRKGQLVSEYREGQQGY
jgi:hypothetical protein